MRLFQRLLADVPFMLTSALEDHIATELALASYLEIEAAQHPVIQRLRDAAKPKIELRQDGTAIVPIEGKLAYKPDPFEMLFNGVEDSRNVVSMLNEVAADTNVKGVLLNIDSPGGMMIGGLEAADAVAALDAQKPVIAWSGGFAASLAYLIASQASEIIGSRTGHFGSIGAVLSLPDITKALEARGIRFDVFTNKEGTLKSIGQPGVSLSDEQRAFIQQRVESSFAEFSSQVLRSRPSISPEAMKGQMLSGKEAKQMGLIDRIGDMNFALSTLRSLIRVR